MLFMELDNILVLQPLQSPCSLNILQARGLYYLMERIKITKNFQNLSFNGIQAFGQFFYLHISIGGNRRNASELSELHARTRARVHLHARLRKDSLASCPL